MVQEVNSRSHHMVAVSKLISVGFKCTYTLWGGTVGIGLSQYLTLLSLVFRMNYYVVTRTFLNASTAAYLSNIVFYSKGQFQDKFYIFKIIEHVTTVTHDSNVFKKT